MTYNGKIALLTTLLVPSIGLAQVNVGDEIGVTEASVRSAFEAQGYVVSEIEFEDDEIEVEVTKAGQAFEFEISPETGLVLEIETEDDDNDD